MTEYYTVTKQVRYGANDDWWLSRELLGSRYLTFEAEGEEGGPRNSRRPNCSGKGWCGISIGRGLDLGQWTESHVSDFLTRAGLSGSVVERLISAAGLKGSAAVSKLEDIKDIELTKAEQYRLFDVVYGFIAQDMQKRAEKIADEFSRVDWANLDPRIFAVLVDLHYQGELRTQTYSIILEPVINNDFEGFKSAIQDVGAWKRASGYPGSFFDIPRHNRRISYLQAATE